MKRIRRYYNSGLSIEHMVYRRKLVPKMMQKHSDFVNSFWPQIV